MSQLLNPPKPPVVSTMPISQTGLAFECTDHNGRTTWQLIQIDDETRKPIGKIKVSEIDIITNFLSIKNGDKK